MKIRLYRVEKKKKKKQKHGYIKSNKAGKEKEETKHDAQTAKVHTVTQRDRLTLNAIHLYQSNGKKITRNPLLTEVNKDYPLQLHVDELWLYAQSPLRGPF